MIYFIIFEQAKILIQCNSCPHIPGQSMWRLWWTK